ncbi:putative multidrug export ATP-binding/permease protein [compost metagenome]
MIFNAFIQVSVVFVEHVYTIKYVLEVVEFGKPFENAVKMILFTVVLVSVKLLITGAIEQRVMPKAVPLLNMKVREQLYNKAKSIDLECYDNPQYYNDFILTVTEADKCVDRMLKTIDKMVQGITGTILGGLFFFMNDPVSIVFVLVPFVFGTILSDRLNKLNFKLKLQRIFIERKRAYLHRVFYLNDYAKDLRLYPALKNKLQADFDQCNDELYAIEQQFVKKRWLLGFLKEYLANNFVIDVLFISYLLFQAIVAKALSYSSVVVLFNTSRDFKNTLVTVSEALPMLGENSLYIEKIRMFLSYETKITSEKNLKVPSTPKKLELRNVSFSYNDQDGNIINNISIVIEPLTKLALVGYNGAGKTTLIKLIMRLYDPTEGEIYLDGINIKDYDVEEYRQRIGAVFQDYKVYASTIKENVLLGEEDVDDDKITDALTKSEFALKLNSLQHGLDTQLTMEFDEEGVNLSGGESQKLAIARTFYRSTNMIILDEPSSALDPIAEYKLNQSMFEAAEDRTLIFISHRLSTTKRSDYILMMEQGSIIERGTHEDLVKSGGKYAAMWNAQAKRYQGYRSNHLTAHHLDGIV